MKRRNRKSQRWKSWNYSTLGFYYFITILTKNRTGYFGYIRNKSMVLNDLGAICQKVWQEIPNHYSMAFLDEYKVMPNHLHGIIYLKSDIKEKNVEFDSNANVGNRYIDSQGVEFDSNANVGNRYICSLLRKINRNQELIPKIIGTFKAAVTRKINEKYHDINFKWQKSYYDRIIRDQKELERIRKYIKNNPLN